MTITNLASFFFSQIRSAEEERNRVYEPVIGIVTDNKDPEKLLRVKVKIPVLSTQDTTWWIPVVSLGAGKDRGWFFLPEVNDEVLVAFEHGDMNHPVVIGTLWNGKDKAPETNPGSNPKRCLVSRSGSRIELDDEKNTITIQDGGGKGVLTFKADDNKLIIEAKQGDVMIQAPAGEMKIFAEGGIDLQAKLNLDFRGKKLNLTGEGGVTIKASGMLALSGGQTEINEGAPKAAECQGEVSEIADPVGGGGGGAAAPRVLKQVTRDGVAGNPSAQGAAASSPGPNGAAANAGGANEAAQPVQVTVRVIGKSGEPVSAAYGGTASGVVNGQTQVTVPAGPFELELSDIKFADPIPPKTGDTVPAARTFRRGPTRTFVATAAEGAVVELQLERAVARLVEVTGFKSAVVLPDALPSLAGCFRRVQNSQDRVFFTGHGAQSAARARNARLYVTGPRDAWAEASAETMTDDDRKAIADWVVGQPGWSGDGDGAVTKETLGLVFDVYDQSISALLGGADIGAIRASLTERLAFPPSAQPPSPPPAPDPLYKYGTDKPPRGGRADHYPFLRCTIDAQVYPSKLAKQATGDAADYLKSLDALNPHLCKNGQWSLVVHDEINLPDHYAKGLRDFIAKEHYEIHLAPLTPSPAESKDDNVVDCGQSHPQAPFEKAPNRHAETREVEVVFVGEAEIPETGHVCGGGSGACTVANCRLYDPRETELEYLQAIVPIVKPHFVELAVQTVDGHPLSGERFTITFADGSTLDGQLDDKGRFHQDGVPKGQFQVLFPDLAQGIFKPEGEQ